MKEKPKNSSTDDLKNSIFFNDLSKEDQQHLLTAIEMGIDDVISKINVLIDEEREMYKAINSEVDAIIQKVADLCVVQHERKAKFQQISNNEQAVRLAEEEQYKNIIN
jgi:hypothetical protein